MRMMLPALLLLGAVSASSAPVSETAPVVVELFQSQGCSSCPPADVALNKLAGRPDVIALNFAVTYWDYLGWKDTFASPAFTQRQRDYAAAGGRDNVSTPQMILNGRTAIVGSGQREVDAAIVRAGRIAGGPAILINGDTVEIGAGKPVAPATLWLVRYDPRAIAVPIRAGENGGRTITHRNIVRQLTMLGHWSGQAAHYTLPRYAGSLRSALILQAGRAGPMLAARRI